MLVFLDETFRKHDKSGEGFGVLSGIAIPEDLFADYQYQIHLARKPYHGSVLNEDDEVKGRLLLNKTTLQNQGAGKHSVKWSLAEDLLNYTRLQNIKVFGVVCFQPDLHTFVSVDETRMDLTYQYLFERIDRYVKIHFPKRHAKIIFDNRDHKTNVKNSKAITNFFSRSSLGRGYDAIIRTPFFATSEGHNYGIQMADLVTTVIGLRFQGKREIAPLYRTIQKMLHHTTVGGREYSSLKVMRAGMKKRPGGI